MSTRIVEKKDQTVSKGMVVAMSCEITKFEDKKETYKVQSESNLNSYYIVKFMDETPVYCSCLDFTNRSLKNPLHICKHMRAIVLAENYGLITDQVKSKSWKDDQYEF